MQIKSMTVSGFRAFTNEAVFDLTANAIVLVGANGQGKTSFFDALLWALVGTIPRLGKEALCVSRYAGSGQARVSVELHQDHETIRVTRITNDQTQRLLVTVNGKPIPDGRAASELHRRLWPDAEYAGSSGDALIGALTRSVYLQQDRVRDFIEANSDSDRFAAISELVGVGRVTELQTELDRSRRVWSRSINEVQRRRDGLEMSAVQTRRRIEDLGEEPTHPHLTEVEWLNWWASVRESGVSADTPLLDSGSAANSLDRAIRNLDAVQRSEHRILDEAQGMLEQWERARELAGSVEDEHLWEELKSAIAHAKDAVVVADDNLASIRERAANDLASLVAEQDDVRARAALSELALRLLEDVCPVCEQEINRDELIQRLQVLAVLEPIEVVPSGEVDQALNERSLATAALATAERQLAEVQISRRESVAQISEFERGMEALGCPFTDWGEAHAFLEQRIKMAHGRVDALRELRTQGEALAIKHARSTEENNRRDLEKRLAYITMQVRKLDVDLSRRKWTAKIAKRLLGKLQESELRVVEGRVQELSPLLMRIYRRMDPHPTFRNVGLHATTHYGRGRLQPTVIDPTHKMGPQDPLLVLSSSQINVLALSIFLSLNLGVATLPLKAVFLDDPVQSLDNINLLGLTDLLRRTKTERQVFVSTHDEMLGKLLARKLRPVQAGERTIVITLRDWSRSGPHVFADNVEQGSTDLRVVA